MAASIKPSVATPQFRTALLRALKNDFPSCQPRIQAADRGRLAFQLFDAAGQARSQLVTVNRRTANTLTRSALTRLIQNAGPTEAGYPKELGGPVVPPEPTPATSRIGFMKGEMTIPADFNEMYREEIEAMFNDYDMVGAFSVALLLAILALATLVARSLLEWRFADELAARG